MSGNLQFFNLTGGSSGGGVTDVTATPPLTSTGGTTPDISTSMNTNRLIGRSTAGVGVMEEIQVGDGLELVGGVLTNTATPTPSGYYGAFHDISIQNALANNTGYAMIFGQTDLSNGVSIVSNGTSLTRITFAHTGVYNLQFSSQFENTDNEQHYVTIWLRKNGNDVAESSSIFTLPPRKNSTTYGQLIPAWNFVFQAVGGDYFEIIWSTDDYIHVTMPTLPATAYSPLVPSVILTATQQSGIMAGTGITALNGLTTDVQTFATGTTGTDFNIVSSGSTHTFNIPSASNLARGLVSIIAQTFAGVKTFLSAPILDSLTASRILATDGSKAVQSLDTATYPSLTELSYVKGVTSAIQTQLNAKQATITGGATTIVSSDLTASRGLVSDANGKVAVSTATSTEVGYLSGVTSAIQTQLNAKQATITGGATTIVSSDLTASRGLVSDANGKVAVSTATSTEVGYLSGVTSAIQTQLNTKISTAKSFMGVLQGTSLASGATQYGCFNYQTLNALEDSRIFVAPNNCTLSNFYVRIYTAQSVAGSLVFTLRKNGVDTSVVVTIASGSVAGTEANSGATSSSYSAGDNVTFRVLNNAIGANSATIHNTSIMVEI